MAAAEDIGDLVVVYEAEAVRNEGTVVVYEGVHEDDDGDLQILWFGVDHREAARIDECIALGVGLAIAPWQILGRTEFGPRSPEEADDAAAHRARFDTD